MKEQWLDKRQGKHYVVLHEPESGSEHHVMFLIGPESCPHCGHVHNVHDPLALGPKERVDQEIQKLQDSHDRMEGYARQHNIPILVAEGKPRKAR